VIGPGSLAFPIRRAIVKRRTPAYTRKRRRRNLVARRPATRDTEVMLLGHGPYELPTATIHTRRPDRATLVGALHGWLATQLRWLKPRAIPVVAAFLAMVGLLAATNYLSALARMPERVTPPVTVKLVVDIDPAFKALNASHEITSHTVIDF